MRPWSSLDWLLAVAAPHANVDFHPNVAATLSKD